MLRLRSWLVPTAILASTSGVVPFLNGCTTVSGPPNDPSSPISVTAAPSASSTAVTVSWSLSSASPSPRSFLVLAFAGGTLVGQEVCSSPTCRSAVIPGLTPGRSYVFAVEEKVGNGYSAPGTSQPVTVQSDCSTAAVCVNVDGTQPGATLDHATSGLLEGINGSTPSSLVAALAPTFWRVSAGPPLCNGQLCINYSGYDSVVRYKPSTIDVLSDAWHNATYKPFQGCTSTLACAQYGDPPPFGGASAPWNNWIAYDRFIINTVRTMERAGRTPTYWDLVNEPPAKSPQNDMYFDGQVSDNLTTSQIEQWLLHTYRDVKLADPFAKTVCPSMEGYYDYPSEAPATQSLLDLSSFLDFAAASGLHCDAFAWHEINFVESPTDFNNQPQDIQTHVARFRALLAKHSSLAAARIFIDEYGAPAAPGAPGPYDLMPGWDVGYLSALAAAGVDEANRTCAAAVDCQYLLDDLLVNTNGVISPSDAYWPYWYFAHMSGRTVPVTSSAEQVSGLASLTSTALTILAGRHETLDNSTGVATPSSTSPEPVTIQIKVPWTVSQVSVARQNYAYSTGATALPPVSTQTLPVQGGLVTISVPGVGDADAFALTVTPN